ncbi:Rhodanese-like protein [Basidiobolus meristosporus CBS 931.73]|uniref:Rhodanese-like protein n=1 Tax=Basidiobolus meristosporus CBS 931.73 TaxID=1314790 RepID=A0A1Y1YCC9_9FUNG|nr:Rhodanese-like protein [Basidiobolus meristosporus CBS 931.73]|eukprot:ORX95680.1 Rhodanese-like protein [Basidiobolus meristosporus CBS 931.73]
MLRFQVLHKVTYRGAIRTFSQGTLAAQNRFTDLVRLARDDAKIEEISVSTLKASYDPKKHQIVDVREVSEQHKGIIPEAICLPRGILERDIEKKVPISKEVVVYCAGGLRSILAAENLKRMGYSVKSLQGGYDVWKESGGEISKY